MKKKRFGQVGISSGNDCLFIHKPSAQFTPISLDPPRPSATKSRFLEHLDCFQVHFLEYITSVVANHNANNSLLMLY